VLCRELDQIRVAYFYFRGRNFYSVCPDFIIMDPSNSNKLYKSLLGKMKLHENYAIIDDSC
jgi:hypothetical protein